MNEQLVIPSENLIYITPTYLKLNKEISEEEYLQIWQFLGNMQGKLLMYVGDLASQEGKLKGGRGLTSELIEKIESITPYKWHTIQNAKSIAIAIKPSIRIEGLGWAHYKLIAPLPEEARADWCQKCAKNKWSVSELRKQIRLALPSPELPPGKYRIFYADPPWNYNTPQHIDAKGFKYESGKQATIIETHYTSMDTDSICALPILEMVWDNAILFLWATVPLINDAMRVASEWGFEYKSQFVWDKVGHNVGYYVSVRHELLLICTKGSCLPDNPKLYDSVQSIEKTDHSRKPEEFRDIIDDLYPPNFNKESDRIELFARGKLPSHWKGWGAEYIETRI